MKPSTSRKVNRSSGWVAADNRRNDALERIAAALEERATDDLAALVERAETAERASAEYFDEALRHKRRANERGEVIERVTAIADAWDAWDGSLGPDGQMHPDASSPQDRDRLRAALTPPTATPDQAGTSAEETST